MKTVAPFIITRVYDAPRERVWQAWTEAERLKAWFAPRDFETITNKLDLRPGGLYHYRLRMPDGGEMWGKWTFREIVKPEKLVFVMSFSDAKGSIARHPMSPNWPRQILSTVTFEEVGSTAKGQGQKTKLSVSGLPLEATELENQTFEDGRDSMKQGWGGTLDGLVAYLEQGK